jgi:NADPH2:quinone reductase
MLIAASNLVPVPAGIDPALAETVLVNGVTAWQMLHRKARVRAGQTILVHGANGGVGTVLCQLALHAGIRVIGTAAPKHHAALRAGGIKPLDYNAPDIEARVRLLAPKGVDAIFDHLGLESARISFRLLARGGSLVCYGNATELNGKSSMISLFFALLTQIAWWNTLPNARQATFYNFWGGSLFSPTAFRRRLREDMSALFDLLAKGEIQPVIAARFALADIGAAMVLAESRTVQGKVIVVM